jgi:preprotein translocase subunit SecE
MLQRTWQSLVEYLKGSIKELKKVIWPSRQKTTRDTLVVIGISLAVAVFLGGLDFLFFNILRSIIQ